VRTAENSCRRASAAAWTPDRQPGRQRLPGRGLSRVGAGPARGADPGPADGLPGGADRVLGVGLHPTAPVGADRPVELDDQLLTLVQADRQPAAVAGGALDRPGPQRRVLGGDLLGELHQLLIALGGRLDGDLCDHTTGVSIDRGRGMGQDVGVDTDHDIDNLRQLHHTGHAFSFNRETWTVPVPAEIQQDCDETPTASERRPVKLLIRPSLRWDRGR
jgi:hypothetical protein